MLQFTNTKTMGCKLIKKIILLAPILLSFCINQGNYTYEELEPNDLPARVTYEEHIRPIMEKKCNPCHSPSGRYGLHGPDYSTYEKTIPSTQTGEESERGFQGIVSNAIDGSSMPPWTKDRFTARDKAIFRKWEKQGFLRN
ncbi:MAG: hypothetical protein D6767_03660 [Candidatus Hydrogenedentota bacterium]|nr:MAG: hypothetical protein D6767_03660 [Candidatus Hydrogenedentota bacterium]